MAAVALAGVAYADWSLTILNLIVTAIAYGELRLLIGSVWPTVILHTIGNSLVLTLLFLLAGIGLHQWRVRKKK